MTLPDELRRTSRNRHPVGFNQHDTKIAGSHPPKPTGCSLRKTYAICVLLCSALLLQARAAEAETIILPPAAVTSEGGGFGGPFWVPTEYQLAYSGELFAGAPEEMVITGIAWRNDGELGRSLDVVVPGFEIWASTFQSPLSELSRFRDQNWGTDRINVFTGENVRIVGATSPDLTEFTVTLVFENPFPYNRTQGQLLLDVKTEGVFTGLANSWMDVSGAPGSVALMADDISGPKVFSGRADALAISYVPEPGVWWVTSVLILILLFRRNRK